MCLNTGTPKNINFSFETNEKLMALGVPILKHSRVFRDAANSLQTNKTSKLTVATVIPCEVFTRVTICGCPAVPPVLTLPALWTVMICLDPAEKAWVPLAAFRT